MRRQELISQLHSLVGGTKRQRRLYHLALKSAMAVLNSDEFRYAVLDFSYTDPNGLKFDNFKRNKSPVWASFDKRVTLGMSNEDIYEALMSGWDKFHQEKDYDIDISAALYRSRFSSTVGYVNNGSPVVHSNTKFWSGHSERVIVAKIAANITHEYMHLMGFTHAVRWNSTRDFTVPYAIGIMVRNLILESTVVDHIFGEIIEINKIVVCRRKWYFLWLKTVCRYE